MGHKSDRCTESRLMYRTEAQDPEHLGEWPEVPPVVVVGPRLTSTYCSESIAEYWLKKSTKIELSDADNSSGREFERDFKGMHRKRAPLASENSRISRSNATRATW